MHDLIHDYCIRRAQRLYGKVSSLDDKLLIAYRAKCSHGWPTGPNDGYFFEHLRHHLASAGHSTEAFQLLQDLDWLGAKMRAGLVFDLVRDVQEAEQDLTESDRAAFLPWYHFLRGNASFLGEHPASFFQQAYNEPVQSPVSLSAQYRWALASETREPSASESTALIPASFLEWLNRPAEWQLPACLMTLQGHTFSVNGVAISGDGFTVVSGSGDSTVKVWDARTGACLATLKGHTGKVTSVALSGNGSTVASASYDQTVKMWDAQMGCCLATLQGYSSYVTGVALSADGCTVASASFDKTVKVWDARTGACRSTLQGHTGPVIGVVISEDESMIVSGAGDSTVKVWDARAGACDATYPQGAPEARAAWLSAGAWNDAALYNIVEGSLHIPDPHGGPELVAFGPFDQAYGPLVDDKILAFNGKGEAFWFQIRRRQGS